MKFISTLFSFLALSLAFVEGTSSEQQCFENEVTNNCISFSIGQGTGCAWMCSYCANQLGTNNYYFTDGVCTYQEGGCVGNPIASVTYTCCSN
jgi:hypothetical protein